MHRGDHTELDNDVDIPLYAPTYTVLSLFLASEVQNVQCEGSGQAAHRNHGEVRRDEGLSSPGAKVVADTVDPRRPEQGGVRGWPLGDDSESPTFALHALLTLFKEMMSIIYCGLSCI